MPEAVDAGTPVVIAGGGWAGLAAATDLCRHGIPVSLLEAAPQLGGRARCVRIGGNLYDNGQHLLAGACHSLLALLRQLAVDPDTAMHRLPLTLQLYRGGDITLRLRAGSALPAPLHLLAALLGARGLALRERLAALRVSRTLLRLNLAPADDCSLQSLLDAGGQSPALVRKLWSPLCIAVMNTPPEAASARLFANVMRAVIGGSPHDSDLLIPRCDLGALLPIPCADYLEHHGGHVELRRRVIGFETHENNIVAVHTGNGSMPCRQLILATPHSVTRRLLSRHPALAPLAARISGLGHAPVTTVYLHYPPDTRLPLPLAGFENGLSQWVFDRRVCGQAGLMAVVISAHGTHLRHSAAGLIEQVAAELALAFPHWPAHREGRVLRGQRATFRTHAGVDLLRPDHRTPVGGLWLAGDYTATDLPATLEGAVCSGLNCARAVRHELCGANMLNFRDAYT